MQSYDRTFSSLTENVKNLKERKGTKKIVKKQRFKFDDYKKCSKNNEIILRSQERVKSEV